jgi:hypothetical protein
MWYLSGSKDYGITYTDITDHPNNFHGFSDAAYVNSKGRKSIAGYVFLVAKGAITWQSKKQSVVALSSTEAEYVALSEASREAYWLRSLYAELGFPQSLPTIIQSDNEGAIAIAKNRQYHKRSKHIDIRWHSIQDMIEDQKI